MTDASKTPRPPRRVKQAMRAYSRAGLERRGEADALRAARSNLSAMQRNFTAQATRLRAFRALGGRVG